MRRSRILWIVVGLAAIGGLLLAACASAPTTSAPAATMLPTSAPAATAAPAATSAPAATEAPAATPVSPVTATAAPTSGSSQGQATSTAVSQAPTAAGPTPTAIVESRLVELEWPPALRLGDSDIIRISLVPVKDGYAVTTEFPDHQVATQTVPVPRPGGYDLSGVARLDGVGFSIEPGGDQTQGLPLDQRVTWRWTITPKAAGQQRLSLSLRLRWTPSAGNTAGSPRETSVYDKGLNVNVSSFFGLSSAQAMTMGFGGIVVGMAMSLPLAATLVIRPRRRSLQAFLPNDALTIEKNAAFELDPTESALLKVLFRHYGRLTLEAEFRSGYSGARTFLALPVRPDGRADAYTIAKLGDRDSIQREHENYERFVKDTLPPITARIQEAPVVRRGTGGESRAALRYTFIGEAGKSPTSLREALLSSPDPALLNKLFATFGPNWWMQRRPYTFRMSQEYDRLLPAHYVLEPVSNSAGRPLILDGRREPAAYDLAVGQVVQIRNLRTAERRADGKSLSLVGDVVPGHPALRARWSSLTAAEGALARVSATRESLLRQFITGCNLNGLSDPIPRLSALMQERVMGTQSTIHGDLNLENVLVGPGGFLWLIDFAQTRDGHTLYDFAHLGAEIIAHILAPQLKSAGDYLRAGDSGGAGQLLAGLRSVASQCLFNPGQSREYELSLCLACLGALKFTNLNLHQRHVLYLAAAQIAAGL